MLLRMEELVRTIHHLVEAGAAGKHCGKKMDPLDQLGPLESLDD